jgi:hypothetical protein
MNKPGGGFRHIVALGMGLVLTAASSAAAEPRLRSFTAGVVFDHFSRTVVWEGDTEAARVLGNLVSARAGFDLGRGVTLCLTAGLSLSDFDDLVFRDLPISLEFGSAALKGFALGAEIEAVLINFGDFEIGAAGRFVSSFGLARTWPLEDFAVPGEAKGKANWMEASAGPRLAYRFSRGFIPYLEVAARWLRADFGMEETLDDLHGTEKKRVHGDLSISVSLGGDIRLAERLMLRAKAGIVPFAGGVDSLASVGFVFAF